MQSKNTHIKFLTIFFLFGFLFQTITYSQEMEDKVEWSILFAETQMKNTILEMNNDSTQHPNQTNAVTGAWEFSTSTWWTSGFFSGSNWYLYELTYQNDYWKNIATRWTKDLELQKNDTGNHDVGFQIFCSYGNAYRITRNEEYKDVILTAANSLASRYNETIGLIRSWSWGSWNYPVIIDNMMNLELLMWAAENGGDEKLRTIAISHAQKTIKNHIRTDGSTYHVVDYNNDGTIKDKSTHQGYNTESTWSRGQAWGLYGYTMMYRFTENDTFLTAAKNLSNYFIDNLPIDLIPYSDFEDPSIPNVSKDASASAIACSALFELAECTTDEKYKNAANNILNSLMDNYLAKNSNYHSIIKRGCVRSGDTERGLSYADYYFLEALYRYRLSKTDVDKAPKEKKISFELSQNYPNPFNPSTTINYTIPVESLHSTSTKNVVLKVYNILGSEVATLVNKEQTPGNYSVKFNTSELNLSSGIYFYKLQFGGFNKTQKMLLVQ